MPVLLSTLRPLHVGWAWVVIVSNAMAGVSVLTGERLWLQTSTGPNTTYPKLIVEASRYKTVKTTYAASHPTAHPLSC